MIKLSKDKKIIESNNNDYFKEVLSFISIILLLIILAGIGLLGYYGMLIFKIIFILLIVFSSLIGSDLIWALDDTFNGLMALPNLVALVILSGQVARITKNYFDRQKGKDVEPMLSAYPEQNEEFKAELNKQ